MRQFRTLVDRINEKLDKDYSVLRRPFVKTCSRPDLVLDWAYIYVPDDNEQSYVRNEITNFIARHNLHSILSMPYRCSELDCYGHQIDPFKEVINPELVHIDIIPKKITGSYLYLLDSQQLCMFYELQKKLKQTLDQ